jgi:hypothetical protein
MQSFWLKNTAVAAFVALGAIGVTIVPASAHYTTTRCDRDGDECYTVRCDDDGDDCRRVSSYPGYFYDRREYRGAYSNGYGDGYGYGNEYGYGNGYGNGFSLYYNNGGGSNWYNGNSYGRRGHDEDDRDDE